MAALDCTAGDQPTFHAHFSERLRIGCALEDDLVVTGTQASSKHAVIIRECVACQDSDLGSINGTLVNGVLIGQPTGLKPADVVQIGDTRIMVLAMAGTAALPLDELI